MTTTQPDQPRTPSAGAPDVVIETARLRIRSLRDDDLADLVALIGNWEVARYGRITHESGSLASVAPDRMGG